MFDSNDEQKIRELRVDYKVKYLEKLFKDFVKEALTEFREEERQFEQQKQPLLTINDIARQFKVCKATIHNWKNRGTITGNKVGKNRYFTYEEVRDALRKHGFEKANTAN